MSLVIISSILVISCWNDGLSSGSTLQQPNINSYLIRYIVFWCQWGHWRYVEAMVFNIYCWFTHWGLMHRKESADMIKFASGFKTNYNLKASSPNMLNNFIENHILFNILVISMLQWQNVIEKKTWYLFFSFMVSLIGVQCDSLK